MEIGQLRYFLAVADSRSFLAAADRLFVSRQAISKGITLLENELNAQLFVRSRSGAMMTPAGIFFYPRASAVVAELDRLEKDMLSMDRTYRPLIQISAAVGLYDLYVPILDAYGEKNRNSVDIQLRSCMDADCEAILLERRADIVLSLSPVRNNMAVCTPFLESPIRILVRRDDPLALKKKLSVADLQESVLLHYTGSRGDRLWLPEIRGSRDVVSNDLSYLFSQLNEARGVMPMPLALIPAYLDFAVARPLVEEVRPWQAYCSVLLQDYHNAFTYNLMSEIAARVFQADV